jgi:hypothetical protein
MGYYSDIRINTTKRGCKRLMELIPEQYKDAVERTMEFDEEEVAGTTFGWDDTRWIECCYPEFDAVLAALKTLGKEGYPVEYIRVGENIDDVDEREYNDTNLLAHHIAVRRQIYIW